MSQAAEILANASNANEGLDAAKKVAVSVEHDGATNTTICTFADHSVLIVCGSQMDAYMP